ncbi:hypothetical protein [Microbacterium album]|uniref:Uncharacterized protein n=1 Tax=Microbacterium album TaxID=2053191 RepID=A0A917MMI1_9MICO|nr:hypothetical protein [Microbacterium album]GGH44563.1 hypothetical protein GCM10010921_19300 [Microbacterium album]
MMRFGPLHHIPDGLVIGDPGRRHLLLLPGSLVHRDGDQPTRSLPWDDIAATRLDLPTTRFRYPGLVSAIVSSVLVAVTLGDPGLDPDDGALEISGSPETTRLAVSRHHVGRYWIGSVGAAQALLDRLAAHAPSRALLADPEAILHRLARTARRGGWRDLPPR